jgi:hypothetical protein
MSEEQYDSLFVSSFVKNYTIFSFALFQQTLNIAFFEEFSTVFIIFTRTNMYLLSFYYCPLTL